MAAAMALVLAACGSPEYEFVSNRDFGNFFKVPSVWDVGDVTETEKEGRPAEQPDGIQLVWHMQFKSTNDAVSYEELEGGQVPNDVVGDVEIYTISEYHKQTKSLSEFRAQRFIIGGVDPLFPPEDLASAIRLVQVNEATSDTLHGSRVVTNVNVSGDEANPVWVTVDLSTRFDAISGEVHSLRMWCTSACYEANRSRIDAVATSWKVKS
jgi:hypothetical protein